MPPRPAGRRLPACPPRPAGLVACPPALLACLFAYLFVVAKLSLLLAGLSSVCLPACPLACLLANSKATRTGTELLSKVKSFS